MICPAAGVSFGCVQMVLTVFGAGPRGVAGAVARRAAGPDGGAGGNQNGSHRPPFDGDAP